MTKSAKVAQPRAEIKNVFNHHYHENKHKFILISHLTETVYTHTSEETLTGFASLWLLLCMSQTHSSVNLVQEGRAQEGEVGRSDMGRLGQPKVPQELGNV